MFGDMVKCLEWNMEHVQLDFLIFCDMYGGQCINLYAQLIHPVHDIAAQE